MIDKANIATVFDAVWRLHGFADAVTACGLDVLAVRKRRNGPRITKMLNDMLPLRVGWTWRARVNTRRACLVVHYEHDLRKNGDVHHTSDAFWLSYREHGGLWQLHAWVGASGEGGKVGAQHGNIWSTLGDEIAGNGYKRW